MSAPCSSQPLLETGPCERELWTALRAKLQELLAGLPPLLRDYLSCRLGFPFATQAGAQAIDWWAVLNSLPALLRLLIEIGLLKPPKGTFPVSPPVPQAVEPLLAPFVAAAAAFLAATGSAVPGGPGPPSPTSPGDPVGFSPRPIPRCG